MGGEPQPPVGVAGADTVHSGSPMSRARKILVRGGVTLLILALLAPLLLAWRVSSGILAVPRSTDRPTGDPRSLLGFDYQELSFTSSDGIALSGWLVPTKEPTRAAAVLVHGHGGSRHSLLDLVPALYTAGYCSVLYDTRGHGSSGSAGPGDGFRDGYLDIVAATKLARERCKVDRVAVIGFSQGAMNAVIAAAADESISALVVQSGGTNTYDVLRAAPTLASLPNWMIALSARFLLLQISAPLEYVVNLDAGQATLIERIAPRPVMIIHGTEDEGLPVGIAGKLYAHAKAPKAFWIVRGAGHMGLRKVAGTEGDPRVIAFHDEYMLKG